MTSKAALLSTAPVHAPPPVSEEIADLIAYWRQRQDLVRAMQRLELQCQSLIRRYMAGAPTPVADDPPEPETPEEEVAAVLAEEGVEAKPRNPIAEREKKRAAAVWAKIKKGAVSDDIAPLALVLAPYLAALPPLEAGRAALEKTCERIVKVMPLYKQWAAPDIRGLGALSLAGLIGEAGCAFGDYKSVAALWKRFGLAVIEGERQRRCLDARKAAAHGYSPTRRAYAYVVSTNIIRAQKASNPSENIPGDTLRNFYDHVRTLEAEKPEARPARSHARALRRMVKELLRQAWRADRRLRGLSLGENVFTSSAGIETPTGPTTRAT